MQPLSQIYVDAWFGGVGSRLLSHVYIDAWSGFVVAGGCWIKSMFMLGLVVLA